MRPTVTCTKCGKQGDFVFFEHLCSDGEMHGGIHMNYSNLTGETEIDNRKLRELLGEILDTANGVPQVNSSWLIDRIQSILGDE